MNSISTFYHWVGISAGGLFQTALYCCVCQMVPKPRSRLVTCILSAVKTRLQSYCETSYSWGGVNQMCILKNSNDLLECIQSKSLSSCNSIKTFDLRELVKLCFIKKKRTDNVNAKTLFCNKKKPHSESTKRLRLISCSSF